MAPTEPQSPCIRACTLDTDTDICLGCYRTLAEITAWSSYRPEEKRRVLATLEERKRAHVRKYGRLPPGPRNPR